MVEILVDVFYSIDWSSTVMHNMKLDEIFIIIVLYKNNLENSRTISTLRTFLNKKVNLFVYDNSPEKQYQEEK